VAGSFEVGVLGPRPPFARIRARSVRRRDPGEHTAHDERSEPAERRFYRLFHTSPVDMGGHSAAGVGPELESVAAMGPEEGRRQAVGQMDALLAEDPVGAGDDGRALRPQPNGDQTNQKGTATK
jgi:hypothetical protein